MRGRGGEEGMRREREERLEKGGEEGEKREQVTGGVEKRRPG